MTERRDPARSVWLAILVPPVLISAIGIGVERLGLFPQFRDHVRGGAATEMLVRSDRVGRELRLIDFVPRNGIGVPSMKRNLAPEEMPSTLQVMPEAIRTNLPVLSVAIEEDDLTNQASGLLANYDERGRGWERPAWVTYFEAGELRFATGVGLRVHGGTSRNMERKSFRLYFRDLYGADSPPPGVLFDGESDPIRSLVVHNDVRIKATDAGVTEWRFVNPIAYEIASELGCVTPRTQPALFYLNGVCQGVYVLKEHISLDYLKARHGHKSFVLATAKPEVGERQVTAGHPRDFFDLCNWAREADEPLTMAEVEERVDVEMLTAWFITILFCGVTDVYQGTYVLDLTDPESRWSWVVWDLDHAFMDLYGQAERAWELDNLRGRLSVLTSGRRDPRRILFERLRAESPEFREYFLEKLTEVLNHRLDDSFLNQLVDRYEGLARDFGLEATEFLWPIREYLARRSAVLREQMATYFDAGPIRRLALTRPEQVPLLVNGMPVEGEFEGWYFADASVRISVQESAEVPDLVWVVNGRAMVAEHGELEVTLISDTRVEVLAAQAAL